MSTQTPLESVDLSDYSFLPTCELPDCERPATVIAQGCMDTHPVCMCDEHLERGLEVVANYVRMYQKVNKRILICGDCHRPVLALDTHLEVKRL